MDPYHDIAAFYDLEHEVFRDDLDFYLNMISEGPVLEIGSGTGRLLAPLADSGLEVWGIDSSAAMLQRARRRLRTHPNAHLVQAAVGELELPIRFRVALFPLNTLWHLPHLEAQLQALAIVHRHLAPGGRLILDLSNPLTMADRGADGEVRQRFERTVEDKQVAGFSAAWDDEAEQRLSLSLMYEELQQDGQTLRSRARLELRYIYRFELELLLRLSRFQLLATYGWYDLRPYSADSPNLIAVADAHEPG
jgi:SAM-dependent methyltransferase